MQTTWTKVSDNTLPADGTHVFVSRADGVVFAAYIDEASGVWREVATNTEINAPVKWMEIPEGLYSEPFVGFSKIARLSREAIITEKIDGKNGCVFIGKSGEFLTGSQTQWITPAKDNHGFSRWAHEHKDELMTLGPGRHFGEWWGSGINRGYGLPKGEKRFSLFNVVRWCLHGQEPQRIPTCDPRTVKMQSVLPPCCGLVPVLWRGVFTTQTVLECLERLRDHGSLAAPGYQNPEGIVVFHTAGNVAFKKTIEKDEEPKSKQ